MSNTLDPVVLGSLQLTAWTDLQSITGYTQTHHHVFRLWEQTVLSRINPQTLSLTAASDRTVL